jgi:phage baseplate assembly protein V
MSTQQHKTPLDHFHAADDARALNLLLRLGTIYAVDHETTPPRAQVQSGGLITGFLPLPEEIGENYRRWRPCRVGTQVLIASPSGDTRQGVIVALYNTESIPQPETDEGVDLILFNDGTEIRKDSEILSVKSKVPVFVSAPEITGEAEEQITLKAPQITLDGTVTCQGGDFHKSGGSMDHDGTNVGSTHVHLGGIPTSPLPTLVPMPL